MNRADPLVTSNLKRRRGDEGFTLVEVLMAMVLLAVGLLGLEALGLSAVRMIGQAEKNSRAAATATLSMEDALLSLRNGTVPAQFCTTTAEGDQLSRAIDLTTATRPQVTVLVTPVGTNLPYRLTSYTFSPDPLLTPPAGAPCA